MNLTFMQDALLDSSSYSAELVTPLIKQLVGYTGYYVEKALKDGEMAGIQ